jgi:SSS family solute:Na+ symporter
MYTAVASNLGKDGFSPISNPQYGWGYVIFQLLFWLSMDTCWQTTAMRTFSARDPETSRKVFQWTGFIFLGRGMLPMLWGIGALALLGPHYNSLEAMPVMVSRILPSGILGLVVAGMLAATMSVNSSYLLGWSSVIAQDIVAPLRKAPLAPRRQVFVNRATNLFVSLFVLFWGIWYTLPGPVYFYLNITATIFLAGAFVCVVAGLYWPGASTAGGYGAMIAGAAGSVAFFFFRVPASYAGLGAFLFAAVGMVAGSSFGRRSSETQSAAAWVLPHPWRRAGARMPCRRLWGSHRDRDARASHSAARITSRDEVRQLPLAPAARPCCCRYALRSAARLRRHSGRPMLCSGAIM